MKITLKRTSPNYRQKLSTIRIMQYLLAATTTLSLVSVIFNFVKYGTDYGIKAILIFVVSVLVALITDMLCGKIFKRNDAGDNKLLNTFLSPVETALIFALTLPIGTPLYVVGVGSFVAIFFGKAIFGGFGQNIFNPALVGRVVVHLSFSSVLLTYLPNATDAATAATPTTALAATNWFGELNISLADLYLGNYQGALGETFTILILILGAILAFKKVLDWRIPVAYLGTAFILAFISGLVMGINPLTNAIVHIGLGGLALGAVFMATDPVTSPTSPLGKIIYGIFLGAITMLIRLKANYPEGVLFSILIMNMFTPFIDMVTTGRTNQKMMKQVIILCSCLVVSAITVGGVSTVLEPVEEKKKEEEKVEEIPDVAFVEFKDGQYIMQVKGFGGNKNPMLLRVTISGDQTAGVTPIEYAGETAGYGEDLLLSGSGEGLNENAQAFYDKVIAGNVTRDEVDGIDTATGATYTAKAVVNAIRGAFEQAPVVNGDSYTYTVTADGFGGKNKPMKVEITVNKATSVVESVNVVDASGETEGYGANLIQGTSGSGLNDKATEFYNTVFGGQMTFDQVSGVDTATGATLTSKGIIEAIQTAIERVDAVLAPNANGAYEVTATGFNKSNPMKVEVKVTGDTVEYVRVLEYPGETAGYGADLIQGVAGSGLNEQASAFYDKVLGGSFAVSELDGIDTATGATFTADGIVDAVKQAVAASQ